MTIFKAFPYILCVDTEKIQKFLGEFKKYKFTKDQVVNVCVNSGGLLGSRVSNLYGLFETLKYWGLTGQDVVRILNDCPEFALQNRKDLLNKKIKLIQLVSGKENTYIRNFIKRHPDIIMK